MFKEFAFRRNNRFWRAYRTKSQALAQPYEPVRLCPWRDNARKKGGARHVVASKHIQTIQKQRTWVRIWLIDADLACGLC